MRGDIEQGIAQGMAPGASKCSALQSGRDKTVASGNPGRSGIRVEAGGGGGETGAGQAGA